MSQTTLTYRQQEIITLLFRFRYLSRSQLQTMLGHTSHSRLSEWLKDLRSHGYVESYYEESYSRVRNQPTIYYLGPAGINFLRQYGRYPEPELRRRYRDHERTLDFTLRRLCVASICLELAGDSSTSFSDDFKTPADLAIDSPDEDLTQLTPDLVIYNRHQNGPDDVSILALLPANAPRYALRQRINLLISYADSGSGTGELDALPRLLVIAAGPADLTYVKRRVKKVMSKLGNEDVQIWLATFDEVRTSGVTSAIWREL